MAQDVGPVASTTQEVAREPAREVVRPRLNPHLRAAQPAPIMAARKWLAAADPSPERPLLNLAQAAPTDAPPELLQRAMIEAISTGRDAAGPEAHLYGPVLGDDALRAEIAQHWSSAYGGAIGSEDVAITAGCNQAFCAAMATLAGPGDAVMLPAPWYFNHKMWLDMAGVRTDPLPCDMTAGALPSVAEAEARLTPETRAIVLVTPNNPTGAEYPPELIAEFAALTRRHGAALVLDETYRDYLSSEAAPHHLFADPEWRGGVVHLYSFSKIYRLTGHRVGAMIAGAPFLAEAEKFLDTVTICPPRLGQIAALAGLRGLGDWRAAQRQEILARKTHFLAEAARLPDGWRVISAGAYFAYVEHPFDAPAEELCRRLAAEQNVLCLPGTMFAPSAAEGRDGWAERCVRIAFANVDEAGVAAAIARLAAFRGEGFSRRNGAGRADDA